MEPNQIPTTPVPPVEPPQPRRRSIVGPVILILLGLAFLSNTLGIFSFNVWEMMWKLWPVWLIAVGLDMMIGRRTSWGSWVVLGLVILIIGGVVSFNNLGWVTFGTVAGPAETIAISEDLNGAKRANVQINSSVGQLRVTSTASDSKLVEGTVYRLDGERIEKDYSGSNGDMTFILKSHGISMPNVNTRHIGPTWSLKLNKNVAMDLKIGTGVGESTIDLAGLTLNSLDVNTGIGQTTLTLPEKGNFQATINSGIGETTLEIPRGLEARIRATKGIGALQVNGNFSRNGSYWVTPGYDNAQNRVDVEIHGGIGEINIRH
ncbi:MAG TPA: toast rack family protein [Symbiobacteriaceae bacterium]|nr:toast rack family protein [Symbiobacteriaceae bacterium]